MVRGTLFATSSALLGEGLLPRLWMQPLPSGVSAEGGSAAGASSRAGAGGAAGPRPIVLCGPSGVGKSTLLTRLMAAHPEDFGFSVSHTTRAPRAGEVEGVHYHFVSVEDIRASIAAGEFLEHAEVHGRYYGTSKTAVDAVGASGRVCVLDIDVQGVAQVQAAGVDVGAYIFVAPPSLEALKARLTARGTETPERMAVRLANAAGELEAAKTLHWDAYIVNDSLEEAYAALERAVAPARAEAAESR